jgi:hypothetical protein
MYFGVAFDGVQLGKNYTVNMYLLRCRDAPPDIAVQSGTVQPFLIIPGPRDPEGGFDPYTSLVMHLFHAYGPRSGDTPVPTLDMLSCIILCSLPVIDSILSCLGLQWLEAIVCYRL